MGLSSHEPMQNLGFIAPFVAVPKSADQLKADYYLEKEKDSSGGGGRVWRLKEKTMLGRVKDSFRTVGTFMRGVSERTARIEGDQLKAMMNIAANPATKHLSKEEKEIFKDPELEALTRNHHFVRLAKQIPGMRKELQAKPKLMRAVTKLAKIGKGMGEMKAQGIQGKMIETDYSMEAVSRFHPFASDELKEEWETSGSQLSFDDWIKEDAAFLPLVSYLKTDEERKPFLLDFQNGIVKREGKPYSTEKEATAHSGRGWAIFVIDPRGQLYSASHIRGRFHHSSFLNGGAVMAAGEIKTDPSGKIIELSNKSGHYHPTVEQNLNLLRLLEKNGVDLSNVKFTELSMGQFFVFNSAKKYLEQDGNCVVDKILSL